MSDTAWDWDVWFDAQYELTERLDKAVAGLSAGKDDAYRVALWSAVIEHAAERLRSLAPPEGNRIPPIDVWVVPKQPHDPAWLTGRGTVWIMSELNADELTPTEARCFAADYLAAADAAEREAMG